MILSKQIMEQYAYRLKEVLNEDFLPTDAPRLKILVEVIVESINNEIKEVINAVHTGL